MGARNGIQAQRWWAHPSWSQWWLVQQHFVHQLETVEGVLADTWVQYITKIKSGIDKKREINNWFKWLYRPSWASRNKFTLGYWNRHHISPLVSSQLTHCLFFLYFTKMDTNKASQNKILSNLFLWDITSSSEYLNLWFFYTSYIQLLRNSLS